MGPGGGAAARRRPGGNHETGLNACIIKNLGYNADATIMLGVARQLERDEMTHRSRRWFGAVAAVLAAVVSVPVGAAPAKKATAKKTTTGAKVSAEKKQTSAKKTTTYSRKRVTSRRARLARARAARYARDMRDLQTPRFKLDAQGTLVPDIRAEAAVIYNPTTGEVLYQENADDTRAIASITKVMTAIVFLEDADDLSREVVVSRQDVRAARVTYIRSNERVRVGELLNLMLVASDNGAARTLARVSSHGPEGFVDAMNAKAAELGLEHTHYADPSGLYSTNVSSALDMARLISYAATDERIGAAMRRAEQTVTTSRRTITVRNTNKLVADPAVSVLGGKTGFIRSSGYCLATLLKMPQVDDTVAVVVLGAKSNAGRFMETRHLFNWITSRAAMLGGGQPPSLQPE